MQDSRLTNVSPKKVKRALMSGAKSSALNHTHRNKAILDKFTDTDIEKIDAAYNRLVSLANQLDINFDSVGNIIFETSSLILPYYAVDTNLDDLVDGDGNYLTISCCK